MTIDNRGLTDKDVVSYMDSLSNWGKWGPEDQLGALNYLTEAKRQQASSLIQDGHVVSLALPLSNVPSKMNTRPAVHLMLGTGDNPASTASMDFVGVAYHGYATSHIDALCHIFWQGKMYNGFPSSEVRVDGAHKNAIDNALTKVVGRGILLDIPPVKGKDWLEPGEAIYIEDLEEVERRQGVTVGEGDILLVRTGRHKRGRSLGDYDPDPATRAGLHASVLPWMFERRISVLGSDGTSDVVPSGFPSIAQPWHLVAIVAMGIHLLDNHDFEALAQACADRSRYEFFCITAPLFLPRGTGSPTNGLAVF